MSNQPKCYYCGKFISINPETISKEWDCKLIWTGGAIPEPSHEEFWHIDCYKETHQKEPSDD